MFTTFFTIFLQQILYDKLIVVISEQKSNFSGEFKLAPVTT